jgi:acetylornithine/N-succinyldiaminopimelate aminotransferase
VPALQDQVARLIHTSNYYEVPLQERWPAKLCEISGLNGVFFCNGPGGQRRRAEDRAQVRPRPRHRAPEIIVYEKAFHGRSIATLSATGNPKVQAGFEPLVEGFVRVPLNDLAAVRARGARATRTWWPCSWKPSRAKAASTRPQRLPAGPAPLCDQQDWLLMLDEVQCGIGRTGKWFAHQWAGIRARRDAAGQGPGLGRADRRHRGRPAR